MTRTEFINAEDKHITVRIVSPEGETRLNRLLNTILSASGDSLLALAEDAKEAAAGMIVKLPEKVQRAIAKVETAGEFTTIHLQAEKPQRGNTNGGS
jgi:hypothetical protein